MIYFWSGDFHNSYPNFKDTTRYFKNGSNNHSISDLDDMEYRKINHGAKKQNSQEISPRPRKNYQQQQWGQKDSIIRRKKNATANYYMPERRKRKYVFMYVIKQFFQFFPIYFLKFVLKKAKTSFFP